MNDDQPFFDWGSGGESLLLERDGKQYKGVLDFHDEGFDGEIEYPMWNVILEDGTEERLYSFDSWKVI